MKGKAPVGIGVSEWHRSMHSMSQVKMTQSGEWSHVMKEESGEVSEDLGVMTWSRSVDRGSWGK